MTIENLKIEDLKVGDLVKLRDDLKNGHTYGSCDYYGKDMNFKDFKKITYVRKDIGAFYVENKSHGHVGYYYAPEMIAEAKRPIEYTTIYKYKELIEEPILTEEERKYLSAVIKPFRHKINSIAKCEHHDYDEQYLFIRYDRSSAVYSPDFYRNSMYTGMKLNVEYTLEELGL